MILSRRAVQAYQNREFDDFRWMKALTTTQIREELRGLRVRPIFQTEPWPHQLVCFYIALCRPQFLFLLDMGLGKSKILADIITQLQREKKLNRAIITVPRIINMASWVDDLAVHSQLEPWSCSISDTAEKWDRLAYPKGDVTLIDYGGLHLALTKREHVSGNKGKYRLIKDDKKLKRVRELYNFVGIDESHKLSSHNNLWFSLMSQLTKTVDYCYAMTGTLFGRDPQSLWSQFYLVDRGETFGENLGLFRATFFTTKVSPWKGTVFEFDPKTEGTLTKMLQHRSLRYDETEVLELPKLIPITRRLTMTAEQREHYLRAVEGLINAEGKLEELDANWVRMRQIISGYLAWKDDYGNHVLPFKENPKLDALEQLVSEMGDSKIVVCYDYTETGRLIVERIKSLGLDLEWLYGGTKDPSASRRRFLTDPKCRVLVMNSEAGGTGNDGLQKVARYMVFYESPTPPITRKQTVKRIHRPGQEQRAFIYDLVMTGSLDAGILAGIKSSTDLYRSVVNGKLTKKVLLGGV